MSETLTGGCQCGAVRFAVDTPLGRAAICYCRMCQKATGGPFMVTVGGQSLRWARGAPARFQSSNKVVRGFCAACGTPLTFKWNRLPEVLAVGAFDDPAQLAPAVQFCLADRVEWLKDLSSLPESPVSDSPWVAEVISYQHPDHDTEVWPPTDGAGA